MFDMNISQITKFLYLFKNTKYIKEQTCGIFALHPVILIV